jgi:hypothetical protein
MPEDYRALTLRFSNVRGRRPREIADTVVVLRLQRRATHLHPSPAGALHVAEHQESLLREGLGFKAERQVVDRVHARSLGLTQCFAKCPFTCQFDRLSDQLCQSLDRLSDHFAKHWADGMRAGCVQVHLRLRPQ